MYRNSSLFSACYPFARARATASAWAVAILCTSGLAGALPGDLATKFRVNDDDPMASIPTLEQRNEDPIEFGYYLQDMLFRGETAVKEKDWARVIKYYEAFAKVVPDRAKVFSRLCLSYAELGQIESAVNACSNAIHLEGALVMDHLRFIRLSLRKTELSEAEFAEIEASLAHVRAHVESHPPERRSAVSVSSASTPDELARNFVEGLKDEQSSGNAENSPANSSASKVNLQVEIEVLACKVAVRLRDSGRVERCLATVRGLNLHPSVIVPIEWAQALLEKDADRATELLEDARSAGLPEAALSAMVQEQTSELGRAPSIGFLRRWVYFVLGGAAVLALVLWGALRQLSSRAGRSKPEAASV